LKKYLGDKFMALVSHTVIIKSLVTMFQRNNIQIAEIGLDRLKTCIDILKSSAPLIAGYWGIDPFSLLDSTPEKPEKKVNRSRVYLEACKLMVQYPQLHIIEAYSPKIAEIFPNEFFDLVFIDGDHSYEATRADIKAWFPKVKFRGLLAGHDYFHWEPGVVKAVDESFGNNFIFLKRVWIHQKKATK